MAPHAEVTTTAIDSYHLITIRAIFVKTYQGEVSVIISV